jgi:exosortase
MNSPLLPLADFRDLSRLARFNLVALLLAMVGLCYQLWPDWSRDPNLSHGFFMPLISLYLIYEARRHGRRRFIVARRNNGIVFGVLLAAAVLGVAIGGLFAAAAGWTHSLVDSSFTVALACFAWAALIAYSDDRERAIGCNWIAFVAVALWLLCTPLPPGFAARLTLALQLWISKTVVATFHLLGIPAVRHGNIIELVNGTVGVEEACSGIRSLISCLFAGLFFSAVLVRRPFVRTVIILAAGPLALAMNLLRSMTLTLLANGGVSISGFWHDATGYIVLGLTSLLLVGLALLLEPKIPR